MTIRELIETLEEHASDYGDDIEVRLAIQPNWPFEHRIGSVVALEPVTQADIDAADPDEDDAPDEERDAVVYIAESSQIGYLPGDASRELGWRG